MPSTRTSMSLHCVELDWNYQRSDWDLDRGEMNIYEEVM